MKSPIYLLRLLLTECGQRCRVSTERDLKRITLRYEHEGFSFLAITLATYGKDLQKSLDQGFVSRDLFTSFSKRAELPELFRGFLENVFVPGDGRLRPDPCVECIRSLRQLTLMWAKVKAMPTPEREQAGFKSYVERERNVYHMALRESQRSLQLDESFDPSMSWMLERRTFNGPGEGTPLLEFLTMSRKLFGPTLSWIDQQVYRGKVVPSHGPGAVAERISGNQKWVRTEWLEQLESMFPISEHYFSSFRDYLGAGAEYTLPGTATPTRVVAVPKTLDKPRIIGIEPLSMQYMQQGLKRLFDEAYEKDSFQGVQNLSKPLIWNTYQEPNQLMARKGSQLGTLATLDLSDASDSVSNLLVQTMLSDYPHLYEGVMATRSRTADVPGEGIIPLSKFASMGSALCFPIEAMVFATICFVGIQRAFQRPLGWRLIHSLVPEVRVYGDDIVVPVEFAQSVTESLEDYGFQVARHKSFWTGKFRESCGKDFYDGEDVTIVRLRRDLPSSRRHVRELASLVEFRNQLYKAGYWATIREIDKWIEEFIPFPAVNEGTEGLGKISYLGYESHKWDAKLQRPMVRAAVLVHKKRESPLDGERALLKWFQHKRSGNPEPLMKDHLRYAGRPIAVDIKHRYVHPDYGVDWRTLI